MEYWWIIDEILNLDDKGQKGYLFDVHVHYPEEIHDLLNGYALAPDNQAIKTNLLDSVS